MFDPFKDFDSAGYLRNFEGEKDLDIVKVAEHDLFRANLPDAVAYLVRLKRLTYVAFCRVHRILFQGFYPWAGQDRVVTAPESAITKGETIFAHPRDAVLAVNQALRLGQDVNKMRQHPGEVMGLFAYGHPFLDGNGRTMLLVHAELCRRAGFSILWHQTRKRDYLRALTDEIASPNNHTLDSYLLQFIGPAQGAGDWIATAAVLPGLDGNDIRDEVARSVLDPEVMAQYHQFERQRGYEIKG